VALSKSSYKLTADTQITKGSGILCSVTINTDGTNNATVKLYDVSAAADVANTNMLYEWVVSGANYSGGRDWVHPVYFAKGLYLDITGTGASCIVERK
jgi:hypothetical protein